MLEYIHFHNEHPSDVFLVIDQLMYLASDISFLYESAILWQFLGAEFNIMYKIFAIGVNSLFRGMYIQLSITQKSLTLSFHIYYSLFNIKKL